MINPKLCSHVWNFAFTYTKAGTFKPEHVAVLFCCKCALCKAIKIKEPKK